MAKQSPTIQKAAPKISEREIQENLWLQLKQGNREALAQIYELFISDMFTFGMSLLADRSFVGDCIQEVFVELWKYKANLSPTNNVKLYLFKSLRNRIYANLAKEKKHIAETDNLDLTLVPSHEALLIADQHDQELQQHLARCIDQLPVRQREVIRYIFFEKYTYEEASHLMTISIRSVYTLAWKAISSLRKWV